MKKIVYLTGSRAEFGLMQKILTGIEADNQLELVLLATGMHLLKEFGETINEVKSEFPQVKIIDATYEEDNPLSISMAAKPPRLLMINPETPLVCWPTGTCLQVKARLKN